MESHVVAHESKDGKVRHPACEWAWANEYFVERHARPAVAERILFKVPPDTRCDYCGAYMADEQGTGLCRNCGAKFIWDQSGLCIQCRLE